MKGAGGGPECCGAANPPGLKKYGAHMSVEDKHCALYRLTGRGTCYTSTRKRAISGSHREALTGALGILHENAGRSMEANPAHYSRLR